MRTAFLMLCVFCFRGFGEEILLKLEKSVVVDGYQAITLKGACLDCYESQTGKYRFICREDTVSYNCVPVVCDDKFRRNSASIVRSSAPSRTSRYYNFLTSFIRINPTYVSWLEANQEELANDIGVVISESALENERLSEQKIILESKLITVDSNVDSLRKVLKKNLVLAKPEQKFLVEIRSLGQAPYGNNNPFPALSVQKFPAYLDSVIRWQIANEEMEADELGSNRIIYGMVYYSRKYGGIFGINGVTNFPEGKSYSSWSYPPIKWLGGTWRYSQVDICKNYFLLYECDCDDSPCIPDTVRIVETEKEIITDTVRVRDTIAILPPEQPPKTTGISKKLDSYAWLGSWFPIKSPKYLGTYAGANLHVALTRRADFSHPFVSLGGDINGFYVHPQYTHVGGGNGDLGFRFSFPGSHAVFSFGPYAGISLLKVKVKEANGTYEGRQTTFLAIERANLDLFYKKFTLTLWQDYIWSPRAWLLSSWNGEPLNSAQDMANSQGELDVGLFMFFLSPWKVEMVKAYNVDIMIPKPILRPVRPGLILEHNILFQERINSRQRNPGFIITTAPALYFQKPRIILSAGTKYSWSIVGQPNEAKYRWAMVVKLNFEIAQRYWLRPENLYEESRSITTPEERSLEELENQETPDDSVDPKDLDFSDSDSGW